jgi:TolB-like protein
MTDAAQSYDKVENNGVPGEPAVRAQLARILKSGPFQRSQRRRRFLEFIVNETLAGRGDRIKGYTIALEVFERPATFDSNVDPTVRMEAARLRDRLREYYEAEGQGDPVRIELPKGTYAPHIEFRQPAAPDLAPSETRVENDGKPAEVDIERAEANPSARRLVLSGPGWKQAAMLATALLLIVAASLAWIKRPNSGRSLPDKPSIAVLPFDNFGGDARWERFADGITEDIITDLSHSKDLLVIARNSTEVYKGKPIDARKIGRDLNVKYVLEGSIQSMGERTRVTAQLVEATTGGHVWSERYDRPVDDLFAVQSDVTQRIAATLAGYEGAVAEAERSLLRRKPPANLTAFDTYLLAMEAKHKVTKESLVEAEVLFRKSLELDPQLARAYVGLVDVQFYLIDLGLAPSIDEALSKMMTAGDMAVTLDPNDGKTHYARGLASLYNGKPEQAVAEFARAETLAPSDADMLICIGWSIPTLGESERAVRLVERALTLNPHYPDWYNQGLSYVYFFGEQYDKSLKYRLQVKKPLAIDYAFLAMAHAYLGRTGEAEAATAHVRRLDPAWNAERYLSEAGGSAAREAELFVDGARKAGLSACVPADKVKGVPNLIRVKSCDHQRAKTAD